MHTCNWFLNIAGSSEHILVVEKLKARGTGTDASDEEFVLK